MNPLAEFENDSIVVNISFITLRRKNHHDAYYGEKEGLVQICSRNRLWLGDVMYDYRYVNIDFIRLMPALEDRLTLLKREHDRLTVELSILKQALMTRS